MYKKLIATVAALLIGMLMFSTSAGAKNNKVDVCHFTTVLTETNIPAGHVISVSEKALPAHLAHGDRTDWDIDLDPAVGGVNCAYIGGS